MGVDGGSPAGADVPACLTSASSARSCGGRGSWTARADVGALGCPKALTAEDAEHAETVWWASMVGVRLGPRTWCDLCVLGALCGERLLDGESRRRTAGLSKSPYRRGRRARRDVWVGVKWWSPGWGHVTGLTSASSACSAVRGSWTARADVGPLGCPKALTAEDAEHAETCGWACQWWSPGWGPLTGLISASSARSAVRGSWTASRWESMFATALVRFVVRR